MRDGETSDVAWAVIAPLLPPVDRARGRWRDHHRVLEGIVFKFRTSLPWRDLPQRLGSRRIVDGRFAHWATDGTFDRLLATAQSRAEMDRLLGPHLPCLPPRPRDQGHDPRTRRPARRPATTP
ncbi:transposase [Streptomyces sp. SR27]|uniref:transposase n=1 Tax=Streptomyces sp. SR27 TaxID=3076630 RepID=UPI003FA3C813